jgi:exonuclease III
VKPSSPAASSVYSQHERYFDRQDRVVDLRQAWLDDLAKDIVKWNEEGDQLIFLGDLNEDLNCDKLHNFFQWLGMQEVILD